MLIRNWKELAAIPNESATHILKVDVKGSSAWLKSKYPKPYTDKLSYMSQIKHLNIYLSTHTFYGSSYKHSTKILKACGFDVEIDNWDAENVEEVKEDLNNDSNPVSSLNSSVSYKEFMDHFHELRIGKG